MSARWSERQDGRDTGRPSDAPAGCPVLVVVAVWVLGVLYLLTHVLVWTIRVVAA